MEKSSPAAQAGYLFQVDLKTDSQNPPLAKTRRSDAGVAQTVSLRHRLPPIFHFTAPKSASSFTTRPRHLICSILFQSLIAWIADRDHAGSLATPQYHYAAGKFVITSKLHYGI